MAELNDEMINNEFTDGDFSYQLNDSFSLWLKDIRAFKPYESKEEELKAAKQIKDDPDARNEFINRHLCLVLAVIRDFKKAHEYYPDINDMISVGNNALLKAVDKFDPEKGYWFSTYARKCIEGKLKNLNAESLAGVPKDKIAELGRLNKLIEECAQEYGRMPETSEIIEYVCDEFTEEEVDELFTIKSRVNIDSLDAEIGDENDATLLDLQEDKSEERPDEYAERKNLEEKLYEIYRRELNDLELDIWMNQDKYTVFRNNEDNPKWLYTKIMVDYSSQIKTRDMARTIVARINKKLRTPAVWSEIQKLKGN